MATDVKDIAERVDVLRDRFTGWAMLIGAISFVLAVWVAAPSLAIDVPLPGGAKVPLNIGYALSIGMPLLAIAYAWSIAPLLAVGRYQDAVAREMGLGNASLSTFEHLRLIGPSAERGPGTRSERSAWCITFFIRILVLFIFPVAGQICIARDYFIALHYFEFDRANHRRMALPCEGDVQPKERIHIFEYFFADKPDQNSHDKDSPKPQYFMVPDGTMEIACLASWKNASSDASSPTEKNCPTPITRPSGADAKCVYTQFPQYKLRINSWANLISLAVVIHLAIFGFGIFSGRYFRRRLAEEMKKPNPPNGH